VRTEGSSAMPHKKEPDSFLRTCAGWRACCARTRRGLGGCGALARARHSHSSVERVIAPMPRASRFQGAQRRAGLIDGLVVNQNACTTTWS